MLTTFEKIKKFINRKPKAVRLAEAVFELLPDEEWAKIRYVGEPDTEDVRDWVLNFAQDSKCVYTMERSMDIARLRIALLKQSDKGIAKCDIYLLFVRELYKNPGNYRTLASYFR